MLPFQLRRSPGDSSTTFLEVKVAGMFSIDGIVSGFETSSIIESLLGFQQTQIDNLSSRKASIATQQSSVKGIEAQLLTLQASLSQLNRLKASVFDLRTAASSHEDMLVADADSAANPGTFRLTIDSLAAAHQIASQGFDSSSAVLGSGQLTFQVGNRSEFTVTLDPSNNTLAGLASTINEQAEDLSASIVFDASSDSYRLLLTSKHTGLSNQISVSSELTGDQTPDFSGPAVEEAADAVVRLGSGPGAITASYESNRIEGLIEDVTLDLRSADPNTTITVEIAADTSVANEAIRAFVDDFNSVIEFIDQQTRFNPETNQASPLLGNRSISTIKTQLLSIVSDTLSGDQRLSRLGQIGVDLNTSGRLVVDSERLEQVLTGQVEGVDIDDVRKLFGLNGTSSNAGIEFLTASARTQSSFGSYQIEITQAAERASISGSNSLTPSVTIDDSNNLFQLTLDGIVSEELRLSNGTYTVEELAKHLEGVINNASSLNVHNVLISVTADNRLRLTSEAYGANSSISSISGSASSVLGFTGNEQDNGQDVAGYFVVDGVEEPAKGSGRILIGRSENENTADLQVVVKLDSTQLVDGPDGEISLTRGITSQLDTFTSQLMNSEFGLLKSLNQDFQTRMDSIDVSIRRVEDITAAKREALIAEFTALESIISELQNTSAFVTSQLSSLSAFRSNNRN